MLATNNCASCASQKRSVLMIQEDVKPLLAFCKGESKHQMAQRPLS